MMTARKNTPLHNGFTLVELSIVLVIIGLLAGGILIGQDLIKNAELRGDISEVEKLDTALTTFQGKYNCKAGDCRNATNFFPDTYNGNGDDLLDPEISLDNPPTYFFEAPEFYFSEYAYVFDHLARAGLITVSPFDAQEETINADTHVPKLKTGSGWMLRRELTRDEVSGIVTPLTSAVHYIGVASGSVDPRYLHSARPYLPIQAYGIDSKIDDGIALTGKTKVSMGDYFFSLSTFSCSGSPESLAAYGLKPDCTYDLGSNEKRGGIAIQSVY